MQTTKKGLPRSLSTVDGFSFNRSTRFDHDKESPGYYEIPRELSRQGTRFGTEKRPDNFTKTEVYSPGPGIYTPSQMKKPLSLYSNSSDLGYRLKLPFNSIPGPGSYKTKNDPSGPKYSIFAKIKRKSEEITPCASNYSPNYSFTLKKTYYNVSFGCGNRHDPSKESSSPGPGHYQIPSSFKVLKRNVIRKFSQSKSLKKHKPN